MDATESKITFKIELSDLKYLEVTSIFYSSNNISKLRGQWPQIKVTITEGHLVTSRSYS